MACVFTEAVVSFTVDSLTCALYVITGAGEVYYKTHDAASLVKLVELGGDDWMDITYVADIEALCCVSRCIHSHCLFSSLIYLFSSPIHPTGDLLVSYNILHPLIHP